VYNRPEYAPDVLVTSVAYLVIKMAGLSNNLQMMLAGAELFFFLTIWCLIVVLPTNLSVS